MQSRLENRRRSYSALPLMLLLALLTSVPAFCQRSGVSAALRNEKPALIGSLYMAHCNPYTSICRNYLIQAFEYDRKELRPFELKITDLNRHKVILADRFSNVLGYMFPLNPDEGTLLATVWGSATLNGIVRVFHLHDDSAKLVFYNSSRFSPQFIQASAGMANPIILLDRYSGGVGAFVPTDAEIWQWVPAARKFVLRSTVPFSRRFVTLARILGERVK